MSLKEAGEYVVPDIFEGEIPEDFLKRVSEKYKLPRRNRTARFLNRIFFHKYLEDDYATDLITRALYRQALAEKAASQAHNEAERGRIDDITGLLNGPTFRNEAGDKIANLDPQERRRLAPNAALLVYLDGKGQKEINDRKGHDAGDNNLRNIGHVLLKIARPGDLLSRTGGDEFAALLFYRTDLILAEEMKTHVDQNLLQFVKEAVDTGRISGAKWCAVNALPGENIANVLKRADPIRSNPQLLEYPPQDILPDRE